MSQQHLRNLQLSQRPNVAVMAQSVSQDSVLVVNSVQFLTLTMVVAGAFYFFSYWVNLLWRVLTKG